MNAEVCCARWGRSISSITSTCNATRPVDPPGTGKWFDAARRAHRRVVAADEVRTHQFGYLTNELDDQEQTPARVSAWEAVTALNEIARRACAADFDVFLDCALEACDRNSVRSLSERVASTAGA